MFSSWDLIKGIVDWPTALIAAAIALFVVAYSPRRARAFVIWIAQYAAFFAVVLAAGLAGRMGYDAGLAMGQAQNINDMRQMYYAAAGAAAGGLLGFVAAGLAVALFFAVLDIRENTRG